MDNTPKGNRLHVALMGRTNVGKSSLLNLMLGQDIAITSPVAGTTTDVVEKAMELLPIGPVLFLDTAGLDDVSELSGARLKKTAKIFDRADIIILVVEPDIWTKYEDTVLAKAQKHKIPIVIVVNKIDLHQPSPDWLKMLTEKTGMFLTVSCSDESQRQTYLDALKQQLLEKAPADFIGTPSLIGDLIPPGGFAVLVVPIDLEAPKGRLILPQVQTIRDILDNDAAAIVVKERELAAALAELENSARDCRDGFPGYSQSHCRCSEKHSCHYLLNIIREAKIRSGSHGRRRSCNREFAARRPDIDSRSLFASRSRRRYRPCENSPLAAAVCRRRFANRYIFRTGLS